MSFYVIHSPKVKKYLCNDRKWSHDLGDAAVVLPHKRQSALLEALLQEVFDAEVLTVAEARELENSYIGKLRIADEPFVVFEPVQENW